MTDVKTKKSGDLTPLMKQFWEIKSFHNDKVLLFRMGDFFEMFHDDAVKAAPIIGIALTQRNKKSEDSTPMCGVPHHSIAGPINKLLAAGLKIAICDQIEDPKLAKGLVKRAVTRVLTPGMVFDADTLDHTKAHYVCAVTEESMSFVDTTTGESFYYEITRSAEKLRLLEILPVAEIVVADATAAWIKEHQLAERFLISEHVTESKDSRSLLTDYITQLCVSDLKLILQPFEKREIEHRLILSQTTLRHLEVFTNYQGKEQGSLFKAIDRTKTSAGSRLLRQWLSFPLMAIPQIETRQKKIGLFRDHMMELKKVREILASMGDMERRIGKIAQPQCHGRDLVSLAASIKVGLQAIRWCEKFFTFDHASCLQVVSDLALQIESTIDDEAPLSVKQGHVIKKGFSQALDELIFTSTHAAEMVEKLEQQEKESTGINSLKIRYNSVFGYYIEITHTHKDKVPARYQRKQTLANAERFYTDELLDLEKKVLSAQSKRFELEFEIYAELRKRVLSLSSDVLKLAAICNELDVISSLSWLSLEESYCCPEFHKPEDVYQKLDLQDSRHAVVEQFVRGKFVANSIVLQPQDCILLTGPNMAGKSTLMRQVALTVILAQMGCYVPATRAKLPIYDSIFTRIGASDQLSEGLSTFMVEMTETAQMLKSASEKSLLILDEVGRGTATYDGLCLAQAILEYILKRKKAQVFFATHYHELTALETQFSQIKNKYMQVLTLANGQIEFLHILQSGAAGQSYGVKVAELAGLPKEITDRATTLLKTFENTAANEVKFSSETKSARSQMSLFETVTALDPEKQKLIDELKMFSITKTSPLEALNQIAKWQEKLN